MKPNVLILTGGTDGERDISLLSARRVTAALCSHFTLCTAVVQPDGTVTHGGRQAYLCPRGLRSDGGLIFETHTVLPIIHGSYGESGMLQGQLDCLGLRYIGCGQLSSALCYSKAHAKVLSAAAGIPTLPYVSLSINCHEDVAKAITKIEEKLPYPLFVKPSRSGSSIGAAPARDRDELAAALSEAALTDPVLLVEKMARGREYEVAVIDTDVLYVSPPGEISYSADYYSYAAKYRSTDTLLQVPAELDAHTAELLREYSLAAWQALSCSGLCRFDFLSDSDGRVYFSEANTMPGMTEHSLFPRLVSESGRSFDSLLRELVRAAL